MNRQADPALAWKKWVGLALILVVAAVLRSQHIKADPPTILPQISGSAGIYFDEGIYCHNARNKILFGKWITDEWNPLVYNAPLTLIYYLGFRLFGISIVTVKAINILFGLLGILLFHAGLRRYLEAGPALALTVLFAFDFYWLMYNRIGLLENFSALCFLLGFYLFVRSEEKRWPVFFLGLTAAVAALSKYLFVYFLISTLLAVAYRAWRRSDARHFSRLPGRRPHGGAALVLRHLPALPLDLQQDRLGLGDALPPPLHRSSIQQPVAQPFASLSPVDAGGGLPAGPFRGLGALEDRPARGRPAGPRALTFLSSSGSPAPSSPWGS